MILKNLTIRRIESWEGKDKGKFEGKMHWEDDCGQAVTVVLDSEFSKALLTFCAPLLTKYAAQSARQIEQAALAAIADSDKPTMALEETAS